MVKVKACGGQRLLLTLCLTVTILTLASALFIPTGLGISDSASTREVIIGFTNTPDLQLLTKYNATVLEVFSVIPAVHAILSQSAIEQLEENSNIEYITDNSQTQAMGAIDWPLQLINATTAWSEGTGMGVKIAILDTGIAPINDLKVYGGYNFVNRNNDTVDRNGHGTMIASIIATQPTSSTGLRGVASDAQLYAVKVLNDNGIGRIDRALSGIQWAIANDMQIISLSWGLNTEGNSALKQVLEIAYNEGILIVAAAGNSGETKPGIVECPACYNTTIAVSAIKEDGSRLGVSSYGPEVELTAPGGNIYAICPDNMVYSGSGTSFAVPYVTGTAALIWAKNSTLTNTEVRDILCQTATNFQPNDNSYRDPCFGYGIVNATAAIQAASNDNTTSSSQQTNDNSVNQPNDQQPLNNNNNNNSPSTPPVAIKANAPINNINNNPPITPPAEDNNPSINPSTPAKTNPPTEPHNNFNVIIIAVSASSILSIMCLIFSATRYSRATNHREP